VYSLTAAEAHTKGNAGNLKVHCRNPRGDNRVGGIQLDIVHRDAFAVPLGGGYHIN